MSEETEKPQLEMLDLLAWLENNRKQLLVTVALVVVAVVVVASVRQKKAEHRLAANDALMHLDRMENGEPYQPKAEEYQKIAQEFAGTPAAERASIMAAGSLFRDGKFFEAQAAFDAYLVQYPDGLFVSEAALGSAAAQDAAGQTNQAISAYQSVMSQFANQPAAHQASMSLAMLYERSGQPEMAHPIYDRLSKTTTRTSFNGEALRRKDDLEDRFPALVPPATNAVSVTPDIPLMLQSPEGGSVAIPPTTQSGESVIGTLSNSLRVVAEKAVSNAVDQAETATGNAAEKAAKSLNDGIQQLLDKPGSEPAPAKP